MASGSGGVAHAAWVVGVANYSINNPLEEPLHDAEDVGKALRGAGYDVTLMLDPTYQQFKLGIAAFTDKLGTASTAIFYFSGHGAQDSKGENFLIPACGVSSEADLEFQGIQLSRILKNMEGRECKLSVCIADACRSEFKGLKRTEKAGGTPHGLGAQFTTPGKNSILAFACAAGSVALDGSGGERNSLYTRCLLRHIATPGVEPTLMMIDVNGDTCKESGGQMDPWVHHSIKARGLFLVPLPVAVAAGGVASVALPLSSTIAGAAEGGGAAALPLAVTDGLVAMSFNPELLPEAPRAVPTVRAAGAGSGTGAAARTLGPGPFFPRRKEAPQQETFSLLGDATDADVASLSATVEVVRAWNCEALTAAVRFTHLRLLKELSVGDTAISDATVATLPASLEVLYAGQCRALTAGASFWHLRALKILNVSGTAISDAAVAAPPDVLEELNVSGCRNLTEAAPFERMRGLRVLSAGMTAISNATVHALPATLEVLRVAHCPAFNGVTSFYHLPALRVLEVGGTDISDTSVACLPASLEELDVSHCSFLSPFPPFLRLRALRKLGVSCTAICDAAVAVLPPSLEELNVRGCRALTPDAPFSRLRALKKLVAGGTAVSELLARTLQAAGVSVTP